MLRLPAAALCVLACLVAPLAAMPPLLAPVPVGATKPAELPGLHNVFRVSEKLCSGSVPEGEVGFRTLQALGIRTVISVDGARPDVAIARRYGLRYVHLPFGYDGCPAPRALEIVRAVRDLPGPIYLHCHHGKHRSAAAAALVHIALDGASNDEAIAFMRRAGTDPVYAGLYGEAAGFAPPTAEQIDRASDRFPAAAPVPPLAAAMVQIDERFEALRQAQRSDWRALGGHPDLVPAYEALQLKELFRELQRTGQTATRPAVFRNRMSAAEREAASMETALRAGDPRRAAAALTAVKATCDSCHARFRNVPQTR